MAKYDLVFDTGGGGTYSVSGVDGEFYVCAKIRNGVTMNNSWVKVKDLVVNEDEVCVETFHGQKMMPHHPPRMLTSKTELP